MLDLNRLFIIFGGWQADVHKTWFKELFTVVQRGKKLNLGKFSGKNNICLIVLSQNLDFFVIKGKLFLFVTQALCYTMLE